jgi:formylglycine-generating enzyme required for sulfatase activity
MGLMRNGRILSGILFALLILSCRFGAASADEATPAPAPPGFVVVPAGKVHPGCSDKEYKERHLGNQSLKEALIYDVWGSEPPFPLGAFLMGRYEVTNAQWKYYLDKNFKVEHTTATGETLKGVASRYVKFGTEAVETEWKAIYAFNWRMLVEEWQKVPDKCPACGKAKGKCAHELKAIWGQGWSIVDPPTDGANDVGSLPLPEGKKLVFYSHRVPEHWYGWCKLAGLNVGREYCNPLKPAAEAFVVPDEEPYISLALRDKDFAAYPVRSVSAREILAFAEWAGCELPTEYEWERAARGDNLRWPYPFGPWDHNKQKSILAGSENEKAQGGPIRVDDASVSGSDSAFGARHMSGNVWELTRTFFDMHPKVVPAPPRPDALANYALVAKGGSFGDRWQMLMVCARTGKVGGEKGELSLRFNNRADSLGFRLARHDRAGYDLLLHSILSLAYDTAAADWYKYVPHAFAMERMAGVEDWKIEDAKAPYIHFRERAAAIAFAPLWVTDLDESGRKAKPSRTKHYVLGALRCDVPLRAGVCLTEQDKRVLLAEREDFDNRLKTWKSLPASKQKHVPEPVKPATYDPDAFEKVTAEHAEEWGLWREATVQPGQWLVVYWNGFIGLANKTLTMPPDVIFMVPGKQIARKNAQPEPAKLVLAPEANEIRVRFQVPEQPSEKKKQIRPPDAEHSEVWALCEAYPPFFLPKSGPTHCWEVEVAFTTEPGALAARAWKPSESVSQASGAAPLGEASDRKKAFEGK